MKALKLLFVAFAALAVASCCSCRKGKSKNNMPLTNTSWQLTQMEGRAFEAKDDAYTLVFNEEGRVAGKGDCNRISGGYTFTDRGVMTLTQMISTRMMCANQANEDKFLKLLHATDGYTIDGNLLMLTSNGELKLVLTAK